MSLIGRFCSETLQLMVVEFIFVHCFIVFNSLLLIEELQYIEQRANVMMLAMTGERFVQLCNAPSERLSE